MLSKLLGADNAHRTNAERRIKTNAEHFLFNRMDIGQPNSTI